MLSLFLAVLGVCAAFIQLLLFREILPVFQIVDIASGLFVAHALMSFAIGVYIASFKKISGNAKKALLFFISLLAVLFFASFGFIREIRDIVSIPAGGGISLKTSFIYIFIAVFPAFLVQGAVFCSSLYFVKASGIKTPVKTVFSYQGLGFAAGCVFFSFFLTEAVGMQIVFFVCALLIIAFSLIIESQKTALYLAALSLTVFFFSATDYVLKIDKALLENSFSGWEVEDYRYSPYGQEVLVQKNNEYAFLVNGVLRFSSPDNDILSSEDFGHIPILHHEKPETVLVIGGGAKYLPMIFSHSVSRVDYLEADAAGAETIKNNIEHLGYVFNDERLNIYSGSSREFLNKTDNKYDLILVGLPFPVTLYINSFYTKEFFELAKKRLNKRGFAAVRLPGRQGFSTFIMAEVNKSVMDAMQSVFDNVQIIPGNQNILIASQGKTPYRMHIKKRLYEIQETTLVLSKYYLDDRMDTEKTRWLKNELKKVEKRELVNTDLNPSAMMLSVLYWQSGFSPYLSVFADKLIKYSYFIVIAVIAVFFLSKSIYKASSFVCGMSAIWLNFTAAYVLQVYTGQLFKWSGVLAAVFISGILLGAFYGSRKVDAPPLNKRMFSVELFFVLWIIICYVLLKFFLVTNVNYLLFMVFVTGLASGFEFAVLIRILKLFGGTSESSLKLYIYGALGGWLAAAGGSFFIFAWGIEKAMVFILFLKFLIFCRWADLHKRGL